MIGRGRGRVIILIHLCWIIPFVIEQIRIVVEKSILIGDMPGAVESCTKNPPIDMPFPTVITPVTRRFEKFGKERCPDGPLALAPAPSHRQVVSSDLLSIV